MRDLLTPPPPVDLGGDDGSARRAHFRMWQIVVSFVTLFLTVWFFTLNVFLGIAFLFLAKHIFVGVLAAGLHYPSQLGRMDDPED